VTDDAKNSQTHDKGPLFAQDFSAGLIPASVETNYYELRVTIMHLQMHDRGMDKARP
jgi:hypothetical protein